MLEWMQSFIGITDITGYEHIIYTAAAAFGIVGISFFYDLAEKILLNFFKK